MDRRKELDLGNNVIMNTRSNRVVGKQAEPGLSRRETIAGASVSLLYAAMPASALAAGTSKQYKGMEKKMDLTGGLDPESEYVLTEAQTTPFMQEGINWWLWDDAGEFGMPRLAVEAMAPDWDHPHVQFNFFRGEELLMRGWGAYPAHKVFGPDGKASHFGAGPLWFDCVEPFRRYRARFDGAPMAGTFTEMARPGFAIERLAPLRFDIEAEAVVPPWIQGTLSADAAEKMASDTVEGEFMGGDRLEQLCRVKGTINFDGREREFTGGALRIRRAGIRKISGFWGHCWQSTVFPSGKAFGYIAYPPRPDGQPSYNEGYIFTGEGELVPARAIHSPWLKDIRFSGEDVSLVLETADGEQHRIGAETFGGMPSIGGLDTGFPPLLQSIVRYSWDGETAFGMMERSNLPEKVTLPA